MAIRVIEVKDLNGLIRALEEPALEQGRFNVFRGHSSDQWRVNTTFSRFSTSRLPEYNPLAFEQLLDRFEHGLTQIGNRELASKSRRGRLEFARHHGIPSPLIDFSYSPFISLWFAFNGVRGSVDKDKFAAVYVLNFNNLGLAYDQYLRGNGRRDSYQQQYGRPPMDVFRWELRDYFAKGYPQPDLKFIPKAASWNAKVQRQMGCFIYDTMDYDRLGYKDLEDFIGNNDAALQVGRDNPIMTKIVVPCSLAGAIFDYLDVIGINGARLMDDYTGVACDVRNTFNFKPRISAWDLKPEI